jgi:hypothetical protein
MNALAVTLPNGHALIIGGQDNLGAFNTVTDYDPATETLQPRAPTLTWHVQHTATVLNDGRVLVVGGDPPNACELYDWSTGPAPCPVPPAGKLAQHAATLLADGRVLITGGSTQGAAQIFDPDAGVWLDAGQPLAPRVAHNQVLLSDGRVLVIGGLVPGTATPLISTELFDPRGVTLLDAGASADAGAPTDAGASSDAGMSMSAPATLRVHCGCTSTDTPLAWALLLAMLALCKKGDRLLFCATRTPRRHGDCARK